MKNALTAVFMLVLLVNSSGETMANNGILSITAGYRERIALPPDAILEVELLDVSRADASSIRISSQQFRMDRVPLSVTLLYDTAVIDDRMSYSISARIMSGGRMLFRTTAAYPVITRESPKQVEIVLQAMRHDRQDTGTDLRIAGVPWAVTEIGGRAFVANDPPMITFQEDGTFALFGGCNRFRGRAELVEGQMTFPHPMAGTKRACAEPRMKLERDVLEALNATVSFRRYGSSLALLNAAGRTTIGFQERPE